MPRGTLLLFDFYEVSKKRFEEMSKSKKGQVFSDVEILSAASEGMSIARIDNKVVFVPFVVPGDVVDVRIVKSKSSYAEGRAIAIKRYSQRRVPAQCPHFGVCGGCKWQTLNYADQLEAKQRQVLDNLQRIGKIDTSSARAICGSERIFHYRNKLEFTFSNRRWMTADEISNPDFKPQPNALGLHIPGLYDKVLDIQYCVLQDDLSNDIRNTIRRYATDNGLEFYDIRTHEGFLRNIVIRNTQAGEWMIIVIVAKDDKQRLFPLLDFLKQEFPQITSLQYIVNEKLNDSYSDLHVVCYSGTPYITEEMAAYREGDAALKYRISPQSFYQTNSQQARNLYGFVAEFADLNGNETVYDLYTGTGTIACFVAKYCNKVVGIEYVEEAVADARVNATLNGFDNTAFFAGDMADILTPDFVAQHGTPDIVITDPPRAGMHEKVVNQLLATLPRKIVYVSCNPATQARDVAMLSEKYVVRAIQPVDMFPHTQHVENVMLLERRDS